MRNKYCGRESINNESDVEQKILYPLLFILRPNLIARIARSWLMILVQGSTSLEDFIFNFLRSILDLRSVYFNSLCFLTGMKPPKRNFH